MIKPKKEPKPQQQPSKLRKEQSSWNKIVDTLPNNLPHPKTILLTPSSSVSSITIDPYPTKKTNQNKVDNFLQQIKTRTTPNITSTAQFPPLNQNIKNNLSNEMSEESSSDDDSLPELFNRGNTSDSESEDENTLDDIETIIRSHKEYKNYSQ